MARCLLLGYCEKCKGTIKLPETCARFIAALHVGIQNVPEDMSTINYELADTLRREQGGR